MKNETEKTLQIHNDMLDAYFQFRSNVADFGGKKLITDYKSTQEIQDDISNMATIDENTIVTYLTSKNYNIVPVDDGTIKWQIWRIIDGSF